MTCGGLVKAKICDFSTPWLSRGCRGAWLDTYSFQARGFYEHLGYSIDDYPPGQSRIFLHKSLRPLRRS
jgi:hypothetical protein